jgi:hypothetical protein
MNHWKEMYGQLTLTKYKLEFFDYATTFYTKYPNYSPKVYLEDYWRSQWNQDEFLIKDSSNWELILNNLKQYDQLPTHLQKLTNHPPAIQNFHALLYSPLSGWGGSRCKFYTKDEQIYELTKSFNSFDMIFCEVFSMFNLSFLANYKFEDFVYIRPFLVRDDLISLSPPDPHALFYESPGITFIILKEPPIVWGNISRPFEYRIWIGIVLATLLIAVCNQVGWKMAKLLRISKYWEDEEDGFLQLSSLVDNFFKINNFLIHPSESQKVWLISVRSFTFLLMSAYSAIILSLILHPNYPWYPKSFSELNSTSNYYVAIPFNSAIEKDLLNSRYILNGVNLWLNRFWNDTKIFNPGGFLSIADSDKEYKYAMLMYSDKKQLYIYSRQELYHTTKYIHRLNSDNEVVLQEMRYCSIAPAATKLHFLMDLLVRNFETGIYMRWKYLEKNYFKYVSFVSARRYVEYPPNTLSRSLNLEDIQTTLCVLGGGLAIASISIFIECYKSSISFVCFIITGLVNMFKGWFGCYKE